MTWLEEARRSLTGSWLLLMRDTGGYRYFAETEAGFWRSFSAIVIIAPLYLYAASIEVALPDDPSPAAPPSLAAAMAGLVLQWIGWPLALALFARPAGLQHFYARYIIAYNWSSVLVIVMLLPPLVLLDLGFIGSGLAVLVSFVLLLVSLYYRWYVAHTAFETTGLIAMALVLADFVLSLLVNRLVG